MKVIFRRVSGFELGFTSPSSAFCCLLIPTINHLSEVLPLLFWGGEPREDSGRKNKTKLEEGGGRFPDCPPRDPGPVMEGGAEGRRKKRRPGCRRRGWKLPGSDICNLMDSDKSPDFVEKLAHKYKGTFTRGFFKKASDMKLQGEHKKNRMEFAEGFLREFLDPYDGDSEDIPNYSDCSLNNCSLGDMSYSGISNSLNVPEEVAIEDSTFLKSPELAKSTNWASPVLESNDVYMQPLNELKLPVETISQEARLLEPSELSVDSRIITEVQGPRLEHSWFMNIDPPKPVRHLENIARAPSQPARLMYDKDIKMYKPLLFKRKLELPHSESEKIKRKKQHLA
ncbi:uncharacterized protein LOC103099300 isoform X2 [Monodelphis domestica]|uniref:uncharacterized protein LOC103099300 isoform X2 n=1 Tax=Monodelphis domestica TaxID=13616 RepID=UPI0024E241FF|nr:uncharacterized protein LOC103099300 isoform X2 [Monodelphis domestica]